MREIKFRVWDTKKEKFLLTSDILLSVDGSVFDFNIDSDLAYNKSNRAVITQFTGLQDVSGEDIYEGDVYNYVNNFIVRKGEYEFQNNLHVGFYFEEIPTGQIIPLTGYKRFTHVGNIYENSELLK